VIERIPIFSFLRVFGVLAVNIALFVLRVILFYPALAHNLKHQHGCRGSHIQ
jgi:hypothetical protein